MVISILINGAFGRMGQMTAKAITANSKFKLAGQTGRDYDLKKAIIDSKADVVIDFTHPSAVFANAETIIDAGAHPVIGTTGLDLAQIKTLQKKCAEKKLGGIIAPNFSIGAILLIKAAQEIAKFFPEFEIIELHHANKADSPSGTALRTAELLNSARGKSVKKEHSSIETIPGAKGAFYKGTPIHSIRLPGLLAHEEIIFGSTGETLTLRHDTIDRECFMPGVCLACEKVTELNNLVYGLEDILE